MAEDSSGRSLGQEESKAALKDVAGCSAWFFTPRAAEDTPTTAESNLMSDDMTRFSTSLLQQQCLAKLVEQQAALELSIKEQVAALRLLVQDQHKELCGKLETASPPSKHVRLSPTALSNGNGTQSAPSGPSLAASAVIMDQGTPSEDTSVYEVGEDADIMRSEMESRTSRRTSRSSKRKGTMSISLQKRVQKLDLDLNLSEDSAGLEPPAETIDHTQPFLTKARAKLVNFVQGTPFELVMGSVIVLNLVLIFAELQWKSYSLSQLLGYRNDDGGFQDAMTFFIFMEYVLNSAYMVELILRLLALGRIYICDWFNILDAIVVLLCCLQTFVLDPLQVDLGGGMVRLMRLFRLLRISKIFRFMNNFTELRILIRTLRVSVASLAYSMMLMGVIVFAAGIFISQLTMGFIEDPEQDLELRKYVFEKFGSSGRATYTVFEASFTGVWATRARPLVESVNPAYSLFWIAYTVIVNFAVIRVISALFLKQTMHVATADAEKRNIENMKDREKCMWMLLDMFEKFDTDGTGMVQARQFQTMSQDESVRENLKTLDISSDEANLLFNVLITDEGMIDYHEFLEGALKLKHGSRALEAVKMEHEIGLLNNRLDSLTECLTELYQVLKPRGKWDPTGKSNQRNMATASAKSYRNSTMAHGCLLSASNGQSNDVDVSIIA
eukprot:TRINITY_DN42832_c0_g3_i1.p1 TRINITY_DN42832_c0_g3~~TRINITY_DN42832_c0_g3_i1.p1  ORF type:complete len:689 (+),score=148.88 TRINITY_DN42832_c0_g3_i1:59-2068(+)